MNQNTAGPWTTGLMPTNIGFQEAGSLPKVALTTIKAYRRYTGAPWAHRPKVLVLGGSGGTGTAGIMLAKYYRAVRPYATSRSYYATPL